MDDQQVKKAVKALLKYIRKEKKEKPKNLLENDETLWLSVGLKKIQEKKTMPVKVPIPNSFRDAESVCLIVKDSKAVKQILGNTNIKIISTEKLKTKYKAYEARRKLCASFDLFLADDNIITMLPSLLGKEFFKKKKLPLPVRINKNLSSKIERCIKSTVLLPVSGPCTSIKIATDQMTQEQIVENILSVNEFLQTKFGDDILNIQLKSSTSVALPIYCNF